MSVSLFYRREKFIIIGGRQSRFLQQRNQPLFGEVRVLFDFAVSAVAYARVAHKLQELAALYMLCGDYANEHSRVDFSWRAVLFSACLFLRRVRLLGNVRKFDFLRLIFGGNFGFCGSFVSCGIRLLLRGLRLLGNVREFDFLRLIFGGNFSFCGSFASCGARLFLRGLRFLGNVREFDFLRLIFGRNFSFCGSFESCGARLFLRGLRLLGNV